MREYLIARCFAHSLTRSLCRCWWCVRTAFSVLSVFEHKNEKKNCGLSIKISCSNLVFFSSVPEQSTRDFVYVSFIVLFILAHIRLSIPSFFSYILNANKPQHPWKRYVTSSFPSICVHSARHCALSRTIKLICVVEWSSSTSFSSKFMDIVLLTDFARRTFAFFLSSFMTVFCSLSLIHSIVHSRCLWSPSRAFHL